MASLPAAGIPPAPPPATQQESPRPRRPPCHSRPILMLINRLIKSGAESTCRRPTKDAGDTREAIIEAAMRGFGEKGFAATGIREIAALAGTNVASISYHFGGKEGLRAACAEHIVDADGRASSPRPAPATRCPPTPEAAERGARPRSCAASSASCCSSREARLVAGFMLREMAAAVERARHHLRAASSKACTARVCAHLGRRHRRSRRESEAVRLAVFADHRPDRLLPHRPPGGRAAHGLAGDRPGRGRGDRRHRRPQPRTPASPPTGGHAP